MACLRWQRLQNNGTQKSTTNTRTCAGGTHAERPASHAHLLGARTARSSGMQRRGGAGALGTAHRRKKRERAIMTTIELARAWVPWLICITPHRAPAHRGTGELRGEGVRGGRRGARCTEDGTRIIRCRAHIYPCACAEDSIHMVGTNAPCPA